MQASSRRKSRLRLTKLKRKPKQNNNTENSKSLQQAPTNSNSNLRPETRGNKRSKDDELRLKHDIYTLSLFHSDYEIMNILKIPNSTYYLYKSKMYKEAKELWQQTMQESMEYRGLHIINSLNFV